MGEERPSREEVLSRLLSQRLFFILRSRDPAWIRETAAAIWDAGGRAVEVTLDSVGAFDAIRALEETIPPGCVLGAGTFRHPEEAAVAWDAGARFVVSPVASRELAEAAAEAGLVAVLGAATPTEIWNAWTWGSDLVKVFPAGSPAAIRRMAAPLSGVPLVAVGGVTVANAAAFLDAGCVAVALGASFFDEVAREAGGDLGAAVRAAIRATA
jgi:2-dehydro-3-deoxyphosphogluconate aldolase / (4S)-4-hydroxy-2-oxoglutarate aldolase